MSEKITYRDVTLYLLGQASESVRERINADVEKPDSQVLAFLDWLGGIEGECQPLSDYPQAAPPRSKPTHLRIFKPTDEERSR